MELNFNCLYEWGRRDGLQTRCSECNKALLFPVRQLACPLLLISLSLSLYCLVKKRSILLPILSTSLMSGDSVTPVKCIAPLAKALCFDRYSTEGRQGTHQAGSAFRCTTRSCTR